MKCIEENTERLDLLQKTLSLEEKQKKRLKDMNIEREKQVQDEKIQKLYDGNGNSNSSVLDQEEALRKQLVDTMIQSATPATTPVVRVLTNVQGKRKTDINTF